MPEPLTEQEQQVLDYLVGYLRRNTYQPSVREIGRQLSIKSTKTVSELLQALADKGWVERDPSRSRGVRLLNLQSATVSVPFKVPTGGTSLPNIEHLELDQHIAGNNTFLVIMPDDMLATHGIRRSDLLLVEPAIERDLDTGDIVFAKRGGVPLIRRWNNDPAPHLEVEDGDATRGGLTVVGRVISVVRRLRAPTGPHGL